MIKFGVPHFGLVPRLRWEGLGFAASSDPDRSESRGVIARSSPGALGTSQTQTLETPNWIALAAAKPTLPRTVRASSGTALALELVHSRRTLSLSAR